MEILLTCEWDASLMLPEIILPVKSHLIQILLVTILNKSVTTE